VEGWSPSTFGVDAHARLQFSLGGRHAVIECRACHRSDDPQLAALTSGRELGSAGVAFDLGEPNCFDCHRDPHQGRFRPGGERPIEGGCATCHGLDRFRPSTLGAEAHGRVGFPIEGAHVRVACEKCHKQMRPADSSATGSLAPGAELSPGLFAADDECASCHNNPHGDQFAARRDGGTCESCHGSGTFLPATAFDHNRQSRFPLFRSHGKVPCNRCHEKRPDALGRLQAVYRPISLGCKECHRRIAPTAPGGGALLPVPAGG
jgi:hypothetical protein